MAKAKLTGWKQKRPYVIQAPEKFEYHELGTTIASDPKLLVGRTVNVSLSDLTNDRSKQHLMVLFEVYEVAGEKAKTRFKKFYISSGYLKSKIRKGVGKIDYQTDLSLQGEKARIKVTVLVPQRVTD
ncbi:MAG: 30S ribosomal protein S3ae, partial [Candidatus Altiarchaeota archaeon]